MPFYGERKTFGTRSERGNRFIERMLTVMMTVKQRGENIIQMLSNRLKLNESM